MTRAMGDTVGQAVGITYEPEVSCRKLNVKTDKFVCVSSDGVWEFLKPKDVAQDINECGENIQTACEKITKKS